MSQRLQQRPERPPAERGVSGLRQSGEFVSVSVVGIGIIGTGNMGGAMWRRLHERGIDAEVFDLRRDVATQLGASVAESAHALVGRNDAVILSLPTSRHVQAAIDDAIDFFRADTLVIDTTTGVPSISREVARTLATRGVHYVDCGVSGGPHGALAGALKIMVGGSDDAFAAAQPILEHLGSRIWRCGDVGGGHAMKAVLNLANQNKMLVELEALALGAKNGLDPHVVADVLDLVVWKDWLLGPEGRRPFGFTLALFAKDFDVANTVATDAGVVLPLGAAGQQLARQLRIEAGDDADLIDAVAVIERWSSVDFRQE
jgi:3-hydroxyisobutyrate dehydrogenase-like beta-hydroxyacid dehydrogenase